MHKLLFLLFVLLLVEPVKALGYSEHITYLSKVMPSVSMSASSFDEIDLATNPEILLWLKDLDTKLDPNYLGTYDAELLLNFGKDGHISAISLNDLHETDLDKFQIFITKLQTLEANSLPGKINPEMVFKLDAKNLYIERSESYLTQLRQGYAGQAPLHDYTTQAKLSKDDTEINISELLNYFQTNSNIALELFKPNYIDYPYIGETLVFLLNDSHYKGLKLYANIVDIQNNAMLVQLNRVGDKLIDLVFRINRPSKDSRSTLATVINSGIGSALGAGITASITSHGIIPGVLALTSMAGTTMKERDELLSFNLVRGDKVILVNTGEISQRGEKK